MDEDDFPIGIVDDKVTLADDDEFEAEMETLEAMFAGEDDETEDSGGASLEGTLERAEKRKIHIWVRG